jgi:hypothetical protein
VDSRRRRTSEESKRGRICLIYFLHTYEERMVKLVEVILSRVRDKKENKGRDEANHSTL